MAKRVVGTQVSHDTTSGDNKVSSSAKCLESHELNKCCGVLYMGVAPTYPPITVANKLPYVIRRMPDKARDRQKLCIELLLCWCTPKEVIQLSIGHAWQFSWHGHNLIKTHCCLWVAESTIFVFIFVWDKCLWFLQFSPNLGTFVHAKILAHVNDSAGSPSY